MQLSHHSWRRDAAPPHLSQQGCPLCSKCNARFACYIFRARLHKTEELTQLVKATVQRKNASFHLNMLNLARVDRLGTHRTFYKYTTLFITLGQYFMLHNPSFCFKQEKCCLNILSPWQSSLGLEFCLWLLHKTTVESTALHSLLLHPRLPGRLTWQCSYRRPLGPLLLSSQPLYLPTH